MKWYHVTDKWTDKKVLVHPRKVSRVEDESDVARICVCPTVSQCIVAIGAYADSFGNMAVYACEAEAIPAEGVFDADVTGEHWILSSTEFRKVWEFEKDEQMLKFPQHNLCGMIDEQIIENVKSALEDFKRYFANHPKNIQWC